MCNTFAFLSSVFLRWCRVRPCVSSFRRAILHSISPPSCRLPSANSNSPLLPPPLRASRLPQLQASCLKLSALFFTPMTKKSSKNSPSQVEDITVVEEKKPSSAQKKRGSEIDEIFARKKRKNSTAEKTKKSEDVTKRPRKTKKYQRKKTEGSDGGDFADPSSRPQKRTEDGLVIYTEEELGINRADAGGTPLCPFDCSCCL